MSAARIIPFAGGRRGVVTITVIWAIAIAAIVVAATQVIAFREATIGRESISRVQARWAARAGVETMIAIMEWHNKNPDPDDALALTRDLESNAFGSVETGTWDIRHFIDGQEWAGPLDENSKLNINVATRTQLLALPSITQDVVDSIYDWRDADNDPQQLGAEAEYYRNRGLGYEPRNGNFHSIAELELVAGAWPQYVRGEDWNLNGRLDPNEDDNKRSAPDDNGDGKLDAGWSQYLTAATRPVTTSASGQPRLDLRKATAAELSARTNIDATQAAAILAYAKTNNARMANILATPLSQLSASRNAGATGGTAANRTGRSSAGRAAGSGAAATTASTIKNLDNKQLRLVLNECSLEDSRTSQANAGKVNLNTASRGLLRDILQLDTRFADSILSRRISKAEGLVSLADIVDLSGATQEQLMILGQVADVTSTVYLISSRGRAEGSGAEAEIVVQVDRSESPVKILEYREP
ncbi:MAG: general secretion pathway protein GspK [Planctomycetes bacterium]|nr:general secretion pathway protein GspK [Planctomycetota bacterium]